MGREDYYLSKHTLYCCLMNTATTCGEEINRFYIINLLIGKSNFKTTNAWFDVNSIIKSIPGNIIGLDT